MKNKTTDKLDKVAQRFIKLLIIGMLLSPVLHAIVRGETIHITNKTDTHVTVKLYKTKIHAIFNIDALDSVQVEIDPMTKAMKGFGYNRRGVFRNSKVRQDIATWNEAVSSYPQSFKNFLYILQSIN